MAKITGALITGAAGFLGSNLAETLLNQGVPVFGVDNFVTGLKSNLDSLKGDKFQFHEFDVSKSWADLIPELEKFPHKFSHVFHFASPASPPLYQAEAFQTIWVNTKGVSEAIKFADTQGARVIFSSTSEIYGDPEVHPQPETYRGNVNTMGIRSCYDEAKRMGETLIFTSNWKNNTKHGLVRIFNTYGPKMNPKDGRVVINMLTYGHRGEKLPIYGDGKQTRSFCYVTDLIEGILRYAQTELVEPVNIGNDKEFTILELAEIVQKKLFPEKDLQIEHSPLPKDDPLQRRPDLTKAQQLLGGWGPKVQLEEGLRNMYAWLKSQDGFL